MVDFSAKIYGLVVPGKPNLAAELAREFGHINGYSESVEDAVFIAGAVSLAFVETDPKTIVREAAKHIHTESPYLRCLDKIIAIADAGKSFEEIERGPIERMAAEYPGTNNVVANGGIIALCLWFGEGDFLKTVNLACRVSDKTDADCNAAGAAAVIGAMHGMKAIPINLAADPGRSWELSVFINNQEVETRLIVGAEKREWQTVNADLTPFTGKVVTLRLYQNLLTNNRLRPVSAAHWKSISLN